MKCLLKEWTDNAQKNLTMVSAMRKNASYSAEQLTVLVTYHKGFRNPAPVSKTLWSRLNCSTKIGNQELAKMPNFIENFSLDQDGIIYSVTHKSYDQEWPGEDTYRT